MLTRRHFIRSLLCSAAVPLVPFAAAKAAAGFKRSDWREMETHAAVYNIHTGQVLSYVDWFNLEDAWTNGWRYKFPVKLTLEHGFTHNPNQAFTLAKPVFERDCRETEELVQFRISEPCSRFISQATYDRAAYQVVSSRDLSVEGEMAMMSDTIG